MTSRSNIQHAVGKDVKVQFDQGELWKWDDQVTYNQSSKPANKQGKLAYLSRQKQLLKDYLGNYNKSTLLVRTKTGPHTSAEKFKFILLYIQWCFWQRFMTEVVL